MALSRKFLTAMGIEADKVDEIIEAHAETVNALKAERDEFKAAAEKLPGIQKELDEANKTLESNNQDGYKSKYDAIKEEFEEYKTKQSEKETTATKAALYRNLLKDAGVSEKRLDAVMKVSDLSALEIDGDKLKDADKLTESVKTEWADFLVTPETKGAGTQTPPEAGGDHATHSIPLIF